MADPPPEYQESKFALIYIGKDADRARLDLYDGSISYRGFARTLAILGHYYISGEIISHAPRSDLKLFLGESEEGSFKQNVIAGVVGAIISAPFTTYINEIVKGWVPGSDSNLKAVVSLLQEQIS